MKRTIITSATLLATILVFIPAALGAQPAPKAPGLRGPHGPGGEFPLERLAAGLDLSEGQIAEIEALISNHKIATAELRARAEAEHEAVRALMESDVFDEAALRAAASQSAETRIELTVERARLKSEINAILTPEQREKAAQLKAERQERREAFRDGWGERQGERRGRAPRPERW